MWWRPLRRLGLAANGTGLTHTAGLFALAPGTNLLRDICRYHCWATPSYSHSNHSGRNACQPCAGLSYISELLCLWWCCAVLAGRPLKLRVHPSSVLFRTQPQLVVFLGCQQNDEGWYEMQGVTAIQPDWLTELAPGVFQRR